MAKYKTNSTHETPVGTIKILDYTPGKRLKNGKKQHPRATIKFLATGGIHNVQTTNIANGKIKDPLAKTVYGVGYIGSTVKIPERKSGSIIRRVYDLWANMLKRCYGEYTGKYVDCSVDNRWHSFTTFLNTISSVPGYSKWEKDSSFHLDKDIRIPGNQVYSLDTCMFVEGSVNVKEGLERRWGRK